MKDAVLQSLCNMSVNGIVSTDTHDIGDPIGIVRGGNSTSLNLNDMSQFTYV